MEFKGQGLGNSILPLKRYTCGPFLLNSAFLSSQRPLGKRKHTVHPQVCLCKFGVKR